MRVYIYACIHVYTSFSYMCVCVMADCPIAYTHIYSPTAHRDSIF